MGKHDLNVSFGCSVDVSDAKANLAILKKSLQEIATMKMPNTGTQLSNDLYEAQQAVQSLQKHLNQAINLNTGNLNLNKFQQSLNKTIADPSPSDSLDLNPHQYRLQEDDSLFLLLHANKPLQP